MDHLLKKVEDLNTSGKKASYQNLVPSFYNFPAIRWSHISQFMMEENTCQYM